MEQRILAISSKWNHHALRTEHQGAVDLANEVGVEEEEGEAEVAVDHHRVEHLTSGEDQDHALHLHHVDHLEADLL